ncbi:serine hydrolase FSH [Stachybotrys elegans]|uniref:Serine hydrolase FSH n=1 Tax=Stachybotrys elegans TaxID=80388 RepID=A0A8K0SFU7_9HYPO|nr:serine hydrolase FSH [Stachybotrys elegans]
MKLLCLHGRGTNSDIFETQLASIIHRLPKSYSFDFIDGEAAVNAAPQVAQVYDGPYLAWHSSHFADEVASAHEYVKDILEEDGPYDGVIGFSQGAALAASLLMAHQIQHPDQPPLFKFAIFLCSVLPLSPSPAIGVEITDFVLNYESSYRSFFGISDEDVSVRAASCKTAYAYRSLNGSFGNIDEDQHGAYKIGIPTFHLLGQTDTFLDFSRYVLDLCERNIAEVFMNPGGHETPSSMESLERVVGLIQRVIELANTEY